MSNLMVCDSWTGVCRQATAAEQLDWDRRQYLEILFMNPDDPRLQDLYPEELRKDV